MPNRLDEFQGYRTKMNARIAEIDHIDYHILQCVAAGMPLNPWNWRGKGLHPIDQGGKEEE